MNSLLNHLFEKNYPLERDELTLSFNIYISQFKEEDYFEVMVAMLKHLENLGYERYKAILRIEKLLQDINGMEKTKSLCLMVELYPYAANALAHDVCDSIELWFENDGNKGLLNYLDERSAKFKDDDFSQKLITWRMNLKNKLHL